MSTESVDRPGRVTEVADLTGAATDATGGSRGGPASPELLELRRSAEKLMGALPLAVGVEVTEIDADRVRVLECARVGASDQAVLLYFHGGGYRLGSADVFRGYGTHLASACRARVLLVDYSLAPEHPFPAALTEATRVYRWLIDSGLPAGRLVVGGDSAGGGLAAALLLEIAARGLPRPAGGVLLSPWADLRNTADSFRSRASTDAMFSLASATEAARLYLAGHPATDPLVSPVLGDWTGAPPILVHVSDAEVLRDDAENLRRAAHAAGVDVRCHVFAGMPHVWHLGIPHQAAAVEAVREIAAFIARVAGHGA
jgi:acetyl esterase/lipase